LGSTWDIPVCFVPLAWTEAEPCGAQRAERLGRSVGPGQRRSGHAPLRFLLHGAPGRLVPRVVRRWHPLPFRNGYRDAGAHRFRPWRWLQRRRNLLPAKGTTAILDADAAVPPFADQHLAPRRDIMAAHRLQLKIVIRVAYYPVIPYGPLALQPEYPIQFRSSRFPAGGEDHAVAGMHAMTGMTDWALGKDGIFFLDRRALQTTIKFFDLRTKQIRQVATLNKPAYEWGGLSLSPDGKWLAYSQVHDAPSDIMLVEHFQ